MTSLTMTVLVVVLMMSSFSLSSLAAAAPPGAAEISCNQLVNELSPCLRYLRGKEDKPSQDCCNGAKQLSDQAKTKEDKQAACECIKKTLRPMPDVDPNKISDIPKQCGVPANLPPIDRNFDCSTIN